mmetsp:Transcript_117672/g.327649  ORF Transcript_117672/g.327649 Transcript_117672/m.327649 type:complete len:237 (-) Transcript_117672:619-1329(-)
MWLRALRERQLLQRLHGPVQAVLLRVELCEGQEDLLFAWMFRDVRLQRLLADPALLLAEGYRRLDHGHAWVAREGLPHAVELSPRLVHLVRLQQQQAFVDCYLNCLLPGKLVLQRLLGRHVDAFQRIEKRLPLRAQSHHVVAGHRQNRDVDLSVLTGALPEHAVVELHCLLRSAPPLQHAAPLHRYRRELFMVFEKPNILLGKVLRLQQLRDAEFLGLVELCFRLCQPPHIHKGAC